MAWTKYQLFLAVLMVATGSINTITAKWADSLEAESSDGKKRHFNHSFVQAVCMFIGEVSCLLVFKILFLVFKKRGDGAEDTEGLTKGNRDFSPFVFVLPAMCDMVGTSIMYVGLNLTYASSFQMLRGAVIVFVALLSLFFLHRVIKKIEWLGIFLVILGLAIVGSADFFSHSSTSVHSQSSVITGDILIVIAQIITAVQMVVEEKFVGGLDVPPLQAVGWEGLFGVTTMGLLLIPFYFIPTPPPFSDNPRDVLEDAVDAVIQMCHTPLIILGLVGMIISIGFFNFAGISVTKEISATTRMVLDSIRTLIIWMFSLFLFGQKFHWLQLLGFITLVCGMCLYNGITPVTCYRLVKKKKGGEEAGETPPAK